MNNPLRNRTRTNKALPGRSGPGNGRSPRFKAFAWILCFAVIVPAPSTAESSKQDELWNAAVGHFAHNENWEPGSIRIVSEELDGRGNLRNREELEYRRIPGEGTIETTVIRAEKNGKDITEKERRRVGNESGDDSDSGGFDFPNPFDPAEQASVRVIRIDERRTIEGVDCVGYDFRMSAEQEREYVGTVWISRETRLPIYLEATLDPLPKMADYASMEASFTHDPNAWYLTDLSFEGAGSFLFIKRRFRASMYFSNYFRHDS